MIKICILVTFVTYTFHVCICLECNSKWRHPSVQTNYFWGREEWFVLILIDRIAITCSITLHNTILHAALHYTIQYYMQYYITQYSITCSITLHNTILHSVLHYTIQYYMQNYITQYNITCSITLHNTIFLIIKIMIWRSNILQTVRDPSFHKLYIYVQYLS